MGSGGRGGGGGGGAPYYKNTNFNKSLINRAKKREYLEYGRFCTDRIPFA